MAKRRQKRLRDRDGELLPPSNPDFDSALEAHMRATAAKSRANEKVKDSHEAIIEMADKLKIGEVYVFESNGVMKRWRRNDKRNFKLATVPQKEAEGLLDG